MNKLLLGLTMKNTKLMKDRAKATIAFLQVLHGKNTNFTLLVINQIIQIDNDELSISRHLGC